MTEHKDEIKEAHEKRMAWWRRAKFGMFIHWGVYSIPARGEWVMYQERIPKDEYRKLADEFNPEKYNPEEWVKLAKKAGMRYMVLTTRHHDGFSLFDSKVSDFTAPRTACGRDLIREYVDACRKHDMRVGFYYSLLDWRYDAYFSGPKKDPSGWKELVEYVHAQVRELMTNYGRIDVLFYDGGWPYTAEDWESEKLNKMVRALQPQIIINNRSQLPEDYETPEQYIPGTFPSPEAPKRDWETCMTLNEHWGYCKGDNNWKSPRVIVWNLARCASGGGNYLLNVGPKPDGTIPEESVRILEKVGEWMRENGESIYGTTRTQVSFPHGTTTLKENKLYLHVFYWNREFALAPYKINVKKAYFLKTGQNIDFKVRGERIIFTDLPETAPDPFDTVIVLEFEGKIESLEPFRPFT
ncbi:alpha-L-fucosidase, partial [Candidatus Aerophobetes bacterium]